ncbi:MAG TPA: regulatory iron-sulfur-containing complex subunit RicT [Candidatus Hydrogenedens sp.]|nr:regulatory iron-sulfur-containing complex subunit RicT [Candidatus Hydrogenedens sp.]HOL19660.1 regulatory iron-sulfur-containing complex subunit RicT [Candidatus Hydrogenedens sp.]HPP57726.1 regulatory iron-sulfur-containing complex subunit RicT [Candidatus Hydrogenedens sp.]
MMNLAKIRFRKPRRVLQALCSEQIILKRDDPCIVQTERGQEWGTCILPAEPCSSEMERNCLNKVIRRAHANDFKTLKDIEQEEKRAFGICLKYIKKHNLPMRLVDSEYTFDKHRLTFYFTAIHRVDFRELVKDLAQEFRTRIELRHIQIRDQSKLVGGIGSCGLHLCCSKWLEQFLSISMRMAKRQNLSLNPSKISGQCGKLLCCLAYEDEMYPPLKLREEELTAEEELNQEEVELLKALEDESPTEQDK